MVNERIIIFGVISDGLIVGQLSAVWSGATRGCTHDVRSTESLTNITKITYPQNFIIKAMEKDGLIVSEVILAAQALFELAKEEELIRDSWDVTKLLYKHMQNVLCKKQTNKIGHFLWFWCDPFNVLYTFISLSRLKDQILHWLKIKCVSFLPLMWIIQHEIYLTVIQHVLVCFHC